VKTISIGHGTFHAEISLEELPNASVRKVRKLFELMFQEPDRNCEAIDTVSVWLSGAIPDAKACWALANQNFTDGWRKIKNKRSRHPEVVKQLQINNQLTDAVKSAKAKYDQLVKLQSVYREFTN
jgi:hypothetical protein